MRNRLNGMIQFQSSPASKGRCNERSCSPEPARRRFNPHRPRKAGATPQWECLWVVMPMFQSSPASKGRCNSAGRCQLPPDVHVSILTGLERPVQRRTRSRPDWLTASFNPHRPRKAGATTPFRSTRYPLPGCFNPHRPRKAGATSTGWRSFAPTLRFQSSPASKGRCNIISPACVVQVSSFQSSPASKGRCNTLPCSRRGTVYRFQSSPASKGRCN